MKKYTVIFKNYRLEPVTVDEISAEQASRAMGNNGLWEYKGKFFQGSAIDSVQPVERERFIELPAKVEREVSEETRRRTAEELRKRGFNVKIPCKNT